MDLASSYGLYKLEIRNWIFANFDENIRILDVGAGRGTYYYLLNDKFKNMDCVEIYEPNIEDHKLRAKYVNVFNENAVNFKYDYYDLIIFGDVLEHMTVKEAQKVLNYAYNRCKNFVVAIPYCLPQDENENKYEKHVQDDLTPENVKERYPNLKLLFGNREYGYYIKNDSMSKRKYSVLTFNFGNYEMVHEIPHPAENVEYIYVTDDPNLKSNMFKNIYLDNWRIIVDDSLKNMSMWDKCMYVRYHPFKYCNTDTCIILAGNIAIKSSLDKLINKFNEDECIFGTMIHPYRNNYFDEYNEWVNTRYYNVNQGNKCASYLYNHGFNYNEYKFLVENGVIICRKCKQVDDINDMTYSLLKYLGGYNEIERIDQTILSYILATHFNDIKFLPMSELIINSDMMCWCQHGSNAPIYDDDFKPTEETYPGFYKGYVFNELKELYK